MHVSRMFACILAAVFGLAPHVAPGQDRAAAREYYLSERGLRGEAAEIELFLTDELRATGYENPERLSEFFAFIMVLHGLDLDKVMRLQSGGIDIVHAMTSDARPFMEQGLFSDPAVLVEVIGYGDSSEVADGYVSSVSARVLDRLKGEATPDTIHVRQRGSFSEGMGSRDMVPEVGDRYLLLLSRPMYEFAVWRRSRSEGATVAPPPDHYAIYRHYHVDDNRVMMGDGSSYDAGSVLQQLRWLQELMEEL